jgi:hypothetical protein
MGIFGKNELVKNSEKLINNIQFWKIIAASKANRLGNYERQQDE